MGNPIFMEDEGRHFLVPRKRMPSSDVRLKSSMNWDTGSMKRSMKTRCVLNFGAVESATISRGGLP